MTIAQALEQYLRQHPPYCSCHFFCKGTKVEAAALANEFSERVEDSETKDFWRIVGLYYFSLSLEEPLPSDALDTLE